MKDAQLIATTNPEARANPMIWEGEEQAEGVFLSVQDDDPLALLGTPSLQLPDAPRLPEDFDPSLALREWLHRVQQALADTAIDEQSRVLDMQTLDSVSRQAVVEILGEGEVSGAVTLDGVRYAIHEAVLPGVWLVTGDDDSQRVEIATLPQAMRDAADSLQLAPFDVPAFDGLMNAPADLAEISDRASRWQHAQPNHVVNFTLLPMNELDQRTVRELLARADLELESGGFGRCRVYATRFRHVWAVQFLNALGHTILDTIEVGGPPSAILASREDFEDSGSRLSEILETYLQ
ncbi:MAG: hydrogenase expression/formation protein [Congregibacter sp.]